MKNESTTRQVSVALSAGWIEGGSFLGSVLAGTLLGYVADRLLGTDPWFIVIGAVLVFYSGFMTLWNYSKRMEDDPRER